MRLTTTSFAACSVGLNTMARLLAFIFVFFVCATTFTSSENSSCSAFFLGSSRAFSSVLYGPFGSAGAGPGLLVNSDSGSSLK